MNNPKLNLPMSSSCEILESEGVTKQNIRFHLLLTKRPETVNQTFRDVKSAKKKQRREVLGNFSFSPVSLCFPRREIRAEIIIKIRVISITNYGWPVTAVIFLYFSESAGGGAESWNLKISVFPPSLTLSHLLIRLLIIIQQKGIDKREREKEGCGRGLPLPLPILIPVDMDTPERNQIGTPVSKIEVILSLISSPRRF